MRTCVQALIGGIMERAKHWTAFHVAQNISGGGGVFGKSIVDGWPVLSDDRAVGDLGLHEKCQR